MRRLLAVAILTAFVIGPGLRLECLLSCAAVEQAVAVVACHSEKSSETTFNAGTDHCLSEALPVTFVAKRGEVQSTPAGSLTSTFIVLSMPEVRADATMPPIIGLAYPPPKLLIPLRV